MRGRLPVYVAILAAAGIGVGMALHERADAPLALGAGTAMPEPREIPEFSFIDQAGHPFGRANLQGRWSLVFTGFTNCPDVCPTTLALMSQLRRQLHRSDLQFVFVSVDPERDKPEVIGRYLAHFDAALVGATGERPEIERFTAGLGLAQVKNPGVGDEYTGDHSTAFVLIDPKARLAGYFQAPHDRAALAADLAALPGA